MTQPPDYALPALVETALRATRTLRALGRVPAVAGDTALANELERRALDLRGCTAVRVEPATASERRA